MYPVWSKERKKRKSKIIDCHTLSVCPGPAENMGTVGTGRAEHRVTVGNRPNNHLLAAPLTLFSPIRPRGTDYALRIGMSQPTLDISAGIFCLTVCVSC